MEGLLLLAFIVFAVMLVGSIVGFCAMSRASGAASQIEALRSEVRRLRQQVEQLASSVARGVESPEPGSLPQAKRAALEGLARKRTPPPAARAAEPVLEEVEDAEPVPEAALVARPAAAPQPVEAAELEEIEPLVSELEAEEVEPPAPPLSRWRDAEWWAKVEEAVGKRWMTYAGGLALFAAVGFFVKYAIDKAWIGPTARVAAGLVLGAGILAAGDRFARRAMRAFGLGLIGAAGLPILYVSLFAAHQFYALVPPWAAFGAMALVTVVGMTLAVRHDSLVVSFLALVGGLLTPILVSTGRDARDALFGYLLILDLGVLGVAFYRRWRALDVLAFLGTAAFYLGWFVTFYVAYERPPLVPALVWLGAFYLTFLTLPFAFHLRARSPATLERFLMGLVVAAAAFWGAYRILHPEQRAALGFAALAMAGCYAALGSLVRRRVPADARGVFAFLAFAMMFLVIAGPLHFRLNGITLAWSAEAVLLLYLGFRYAYRPVRIGGLVVLGLAVLRLFARHWPLHAEPFALLLNRPFGVAAFVCLAGGAFAVLHHRWREDASAADRAIKIAVALGAGVLGLVVLHAEVGGWFAQRAARYAAAPAYLSCSAGAVVWAVGALAFLAAGLRARCVAARVTGLAALLVGGIVVGLAYAPEFYVHWRPFGNARFWAALLLAAALFAHGEARRRLTARCSPAEARAGRWLSLVAGLALLVALSEELHGWLDTMGRDYAGCGVAALWAAGAVAYLLAGLRARVLAWRGTGLLAVAVAGILGGVLYGSGPLVGSWHFLNLRFGVALLVVAVAFGHGSLVRACREVCSEEERSVGEFVRVLAALALLVASSIELHCLLADPGGIYEARCGVAALWALASVAFLATGIRLPSRGWRLAGVLVLAGAAFLACRLFARGMLVAFTLFVNFRFAACLLCVAAVFAFGRVLRGCAEVTTADEQRGGAFLTWLGRLLLLVVLSVDGYLFAVRTAASAQQARWSSQMALSLVWSLYAVAMLAVGFWTRERALRLSALGLFGATVVKLVLVDLAIVRQEQIFRILSFFVAGVLMIGGSYLYHRVEKHVEKHWGEAE